MNTENQLTAPPTLPETQSGTPEKRETAPPLVLHRNGTHRPQKHTRSGKIWAIVDRLGGEKALRSGKLRRRKVLLSCQKNRIGTPNMVSSQLGLYRKFHGIEGGAIARNQISLQEKELEIYRQNLPSDSKSQLTPENGNENQLQKAVAS